MPELPITAMFGTGSSQTATELRISKSGLAAVLTAAGYSFTPKADNTLDELVAALVCAGLVVLTPEARTQDPTTRNIEFNFDPAIGFDSPTIDGQTFQRHTVDIAFYKPIVTPQINPTDY